MGGKFPKSLPTRVRENFLEASRGGAARACMALQASEPPPCRGWVTVGEVECRFLARNVEEEALAAVSGLET